MNEAGQCRWFFDGTEMGESLAYPHFCTNGKTCVQPPVPNPPPPYGFEIDTDCV